MLKSALYLLIAFSSLFLYACNRDNGSVAPPATSPSTQPEKRIPTSRKLRAVTQPLKSVALYVHDDVVYANGGPFFVRAFSSRGTPREASIESDFYGIVLDAAGILDLNYLLIGNQIDPFHFGNNHQFTIPISRTSHAFFFTDEDIVFPAGNSAIADDGPFLSLRFHNGKDNSAPALVGWNVEALQADRRWTGKTDSPLVLNNVKVQRIECTITNPTTGESAFYVIFPKLRGAQPGLVVCDSYLSHYAGAFVSSLDKMENDQYFVKLREDRRPYRGAVVCTGDSFALGKVIEATPDGLIYERNGKRLRSKMGSLLDLADTDLQPATRSANVESPTVFVGLIMEDGATFAILEKRVPRMPSQQFKLKEGDAFGRGKITQISYDGLDFVQDGKTSHILLGTPVEEKNGTEPGTSNSTKVE